MLRFRLTNVFGFLETRLFVCFFVVHFAQAAEPRDSSSTRTVSRANTPSSLEKEALVSHVESGKYSQVRMKTEVKVVSQDFFIRYAKDLGLSKDDVFKPVFTRTNPVQRAKSETLIRYQQHYKNLPVVGVEYVLQTDSANRVLTGSGKIISGLEVDTTPSVPESGALEAAANVTWLIKCASGFSPRGLTSSVTITSGRHCRMRRTMCSSSRFKALPSLVLFHRAST